jgi:hypothetical protein
MKRVTGTDGRVLDATCTAQLLCRQLNEHVTLDSRKKQTRLKNSTLIKPCAGRRRRRRRRRKK